jgi:hypothetical protein
MTGTGSIVLLSVALSRAYKFRRVPRHLDHRVDPIGTLRDINWHRPSQEVCPADLIDEPATRNGKM